MYFSHEGVNLVFIRPFCDLFRFNITLKVRRLTPPLGETRSWDDLGNGGNLPPPSTPFSDSKMDSACGMCVHCATWETQGEGDKYPRKFFPVDFQLNSSARRLVQLSTISIDPLRIGNFCYLLIGSEQERISGSAGNRKLDDSNIMLVATQYRLIAIRVVKFSF